MVQIITPHTCRTCIHYHLEGVNERICRRYPPTSTPIIVPVQAQITGAPPEFRLVSRVSTYPVVEPSWSCGEYKRNDTISHEMLPEPKPMRKMVANLDHVNGDN